MRPQGSTTSGLENRQGSVNGDSSESGVDEAGGRSDCKMKLNGPNGPNGGKKGLQRVVHVVAKRFVRL